MCRRGTLNPHALAAPAPQIGTGHSPTWTDTRSPWFVIARADVAHTLSHRLPWPDCTLVARCSYTERTTAWTPPASGSPGPRNREKDG